MPRPFPSRVRRTLLSAPVLIGAPWLASLSNRAWAQAGAGMRESSAPPMPELGSKLEVPAMPLIGGGNFDPAQAQGKVLVLYWWASWCPFCAQQSPAVQKLHETASAQDLLVLTLSVDRQLEDARNYMQQRNYSFPTVFVTPEIHESFPKPAGLPVTLALGRDGLLVQAERGQMFDEDVLELTRWAG